MNKKQILIELEKDPRMIIPLLQDNDFAWAKELWGEYEISSKKKKKTYIKLAVNIYMNRGYKGHLHHIVLLIPDKQLEYIKETL